MTLDKSLPRVQSADTNSTSVVCLRVTNQFPTPDELLRSRPKGVNRATEKPAGMQYCRTVVERTCGVMIATERHLLLGLDIFSDQATTIRASHMESWSEPFFSPQWLPSDMFPCLRVKSQYISSTHLEFPPCPKGIVFSSFL